MFKEILFAFFACCMLAEVQSNTIYSLAGYALPDGISTDNPLGMIQGLQSTLQSHFNMIPSELRTEPYLRAKNMFDVAATRATQFASNVNRLPNPASAIAANLAPTWLDRLPLPLKQLMNMARYVRKHCPLCCMIDKAIGAGNIPAESYVVDASGNIFREKDQQLIPSNYAINGQNLVDMAGVTIISLS